MKNKILVGLIIAFLAGIVYYTTPRIDYIIENGKEYVVSENGKPTFRELTKTDKQEAILREVTK